MHKSIAVISDIHSNRLALEAVLQDISERQVDIVVNLGDSLFGPVDPLGTAQAIDVSQEYNSCYGELQSNFAGQKERFCYISICKTPYQ